MSDGSATSISIGRMLNHSSASARDGGRERSKRGGNRTATNGQCRRRVPDARPSSVVIAKSASTIISVRAGWPNRRSSHPPSNAPDAQRDEHHGEQKREDGAEAAEQHGKMSQPDASPCRAQRTPTRPAQERAQSTTPEAIVVVRRLVAAHAAMTDTSRAIPRRRTGRSNQIQPDGNELRGHQSDCRHQHEVGQKRAGRSAGGIDAVEQRRRASPTTAGPIARPREPAPSTSHPSAPS